jgi:hypothetical protein
MIALESLIILCLEYLKGEINVNDLSFDID